ncbi:hypothetical protein EDD85DRAFT_942593 [Armillaria nabsnona]|nr:hypothetical protein EDD85DRAFT_942593 [Armillaria nabsnona]
MAVVRKKCRTYDTETQELDSPATTVVWTTWLCPIVTETLKGGRTRLRGANPTTTSRTTPTRTLEKKRRRRSRWNVQAKAKAAKKRADGIILSFPILYNMERVGQPDEE